MAELIVITSGKGGTGKTSLTAGIGVALAQEGAQVLCIDGDIGLRNLDISLGMTDAVLMDFTDVIEGRASLHRAAVPHPTIPRLSLLTAPLSGSAETIKIEDFKAMLQEARQGFDYILIDCPAGLDFGFQLASCDADEAIVVSLSDFSALRDAQRVVGELMPTMKSIKLVVNRVQGKLLKLMGITIDDIMDSVGLPLLGLVPEDRQVVLAPSKGKALLQQQKFGAANAYTNIAKRIMGQSLPLMKIK